MKSTPNTKTVAWIVLALMVVFLAVQFFPYFSYGEGETASLAGYLAMPGDYPALEASLTEQLGSFEANDIVGAVILPQLAAVVLIILIIKFRDNTVLMGASALWGIWGIINFATNAALQLGGGVRTAILAVLAATVLLCAVAVVLKVTGMKREQNASEDAAGQKQALAH